MKIKTGRLPILTLFLCVVAANALFIDQAYHMDDSIYLLLARNVQQSPWFPQDHPTYFEGLYVPDLASTEHALPLTSYWMALIAQLANGFTEVSQHLGFLVFPLILSCSMYLLARRFTTHPLLASLNLMFLPVVFVMSHTLMTDIPQLALSVTSVALFCSGIEQRRWLRTSAAAVSAALAAFISYAALCLIPLLAFYAMLRKDRRALATIVIVPAALFGIWLGISYVHYGRLPPGQLLGFYLVAQKVLAPSLVVRKAVYVILAIGAVTIFPLAVLLFNRKAAVVTGIVVAAAAMWFVNAFQYAAIEQIIFVLFFCSGFAAIVQCAVVARRDRESLFLGVWFFGTIVFCVLAYMTGAARYVMTAAPPLVLLFYRRLEHTLDTDRLRKIAGANLILGALLALVVAQGDYKFADIYRQFSSSSRPQWFAGEWGLRAYLETRGATELGRRDARPRPGDILAIPSLATPYDTMYGDRLSLDSIVLVAPSEAQFSVPELPANSELVFTAGLPFPEKSDGLNLRIEFDANGSHRQVFARRITSGEGRRWATEGIPLSELAGRAGTIVFTTDSGDSGTRDADWIAIARARISARTPEGEVVAFDFREHLAEMRVVPSPDVQYGTVGNLPVFPMNVWLGQEPAAALLATHAFSPNSIIRTLDPVAHAGFWSMNWGMLPFSFARSNSILETIRVYSITRSIESYDESPPLWY